MEMISNALKTALKAPVKKTVHCDIHGDFVSVQNPLFPFIWSTCPKCKEIEKQEREKEEREALAIAKKASWENRVEHAFIPPRFKDKNFENFIVETIHQKEAFKFAKSYADEFEKNLKRGRSVIFCGAPGTGKTHLAIAIMNSIMKNDFSAFFTSVSRLMRAIKDTWRKDSESSELKIMNDLIFPDLLVIDEIGVQFGSETEKNFLFDVVNSRYENVKPSILISNLTKDEIKAFIGERVFDRMRENGGTLVPFNWSSFRGNAS